MEMVREEDGRRFITVGIVLKNKAYSPQNPREAKLMAERVTIHD